MTSKNKQQTVFTTIDLKTYGMIQQACINWALIIVSAKWERCGVPNVGANLVFALELKTFANNCSRANIRFAPTLWPK